MGNMGSAHPLVEVNVSFKFEGNPSISKGVIERTRIGDGRTDGPTDRPTDRPTDQPMRQSVSSIAPPHFVVGYNKKVDLMLCFDHIFNVRNTNGLKLFLNSHKNHLKSQ